LKKETILLVGGTGFLGSYILRQLVASGYNVKALKRQESKTDLVRDVQDQVEWVIGDILDIFSIEEALKNVDYVVNAAAVVGFDPKRKSEMLQVGVDGTANLVNLSLEAGIKKFIHISSIAALGRKKVYENIDEEQIFSHSEFDTSYGLSKFLAEQEVWRAHAEGLPVTILNPSFILGAGYWDSSSVALFKKLYEGLKYYPKGTNGFVDVRDVSNAVEKCLFADFYGQRFIISSENRPYKDVFASILNHFGLENKTKMLTPFLGQLAWRVEALKSMLFNHKPAITRENVKSTSTITFYDNRKSKEILGLEYSSIASVLEETVFLFKNSFPQGQNFGILPIKH